MPCCIRCWELGVGILFFYFRPPAAGSLAGRWGSGALVVLGLGGRFRGVPCFRGHDPASQHGALCARGVGDRGPVLSARSLSRPHLGGQRRPGAESLPSAWRWSLPWPWLRAPSTRSWRLTTTSTSDPRYRIENRPTAPAEHGSRRGRRIQPAFPQFCDHQRRQDHYLAVLHGFRILPPLPHGHLQSVAELDAPHGLVQ